MEKQQYLYKSPSHAVNLNEMRLKDKWCDVTIKVNEKEIRAHKVILAANLKYFDGMLSNDSFQESKDGVVIMESVEEADLEAFVSYAYTGEILLTDSNALNLLELANYLSEDDIKEACIEFLLKHLKVEEACRAFKYSSSINCLSLKNKAKMTIIRNFDNCLKSADYFDFHYEHLTDILSGEKSQPAEWQKKFFKGIISWIMHDAENRKIHLNDLLDSINVSMLTADDLLGYLYENMADRNDEYGILRNTFFYHQDKKKEQIKQGQALMVVDREGSNFSFQFYNFSEEKWSSVYNIPYTGGYICPSTVVLNDKLYYISQCPEFNRLQVFDPVTKQNTRLHSSSSILRFTALTACNRFVYLCGGLKKDNSTSNQCLRYDPIQNSLVTITPMEMAKSHGAAIFFQGCIYYLGGFDGFSFSTALDSVEKYDPYTKKWTAIASMRERRYYHAVAVLDEKLYACGGLSEAVTVTNSLEVYDPTTNSWQLVASMNEPRHRFSLIAYEGKLLAIGGNSKKSIEVYDPSKNHWQYKMSADLQIITPIAGCISCSSIANVT